MKTITNNKIALIVRACARRMVRVYTRALCVCLVVMLLLASHVSTASAAFNKQINYQGKLTTPSNVAVADGTYHMLFKLYTAPTGGSPVWSEDRSTAAGDRVTVTNGLFSVMLGSSTPLTGVDFNQTLYLGVEIGGAAGAASFDGEMTPRKTLGAVPAAFVADTVDGLSSEQFLRADAANATNTATTFLTVTQNGTGHIAEFIGESDIPVLTIASDGSIGIGTTTPNTLLDLGGNGGLSMNGGFGFGGGNILMDGGDIVSVGNLGIGTSSPYAKLSVVGQAVAAYFTATTSTASTFPYASSTAISVSGTGFFGTASTTNLTISSISSCSGSSALTTNSSGVVSCGAIASGAAFPFTPATNFGVNTSATSTPIWAQAGVYASSTSQFVNASTTNLTVFNSAYFPGGGAWNSSGNLGVGTTAPSTNFGVQGSGYFSDRLGVGAVPNSSVFTVAGANGGSLNFGDPNITSEFDGFSVTSLNQGIDGGQIQMRMSYDEGYNLEYTNGLITANNAGINLQTSNTSFQVVDGAAHLTSGNFGVATDTPSAALAIQGAGYISSNLFVGGTITSTSSVASILPYASTTALSVSGTGFFGTASTTNLTISSISSCSGSSALTTNSSGVVSCGAIASGAAFPFTPATNFGVNTSATSTPIWAQGGIFASSTSHFASADFVNSTTTSSAYFPGGVWNASGNVGIATTAPVYNLSVVGESAFYDSIHVLGAGSEPNGQVSLSANIVPGFEGGLYDFNDNVVAVINNQTGYYQFAKRALNISETTGNAALGTSTPTSKLTVWGNGSGSNMLANFVNAASSTVLGLFENGNVGIGTTTLSGNALVNLYKQDDYSLTLSNQGTFTTALRFENDGVNVAEIEIDAAVNQFEIAAPTDYTIQFRTSGAIVGEIDTGGNWEFQKGNVTSVLGNIGAGTSSPYAQLSASSTDRVTGVFDQRGSSDILQLQKDGTNLFNFTSTGRLGIGTTSPSAALAIQGAGYISSGLFVGGNITSTSSVASILPYASTTALSVSGTGFFGTASTTNLTISSISSCSGSSALTTNSSGVVSCGAIASGAAFPFTPATNFGVNTSATSTPIWAQGGIFASSTSQFANATATALTLNGAFFDSTGSKGTNGMVLQTTGSVTQWVATSTLGFGATGGGPSLIGAGGNAVTLTLNQFCSMIGSISCSSTQSFRESAVAAAGTIGNFTVRTQAANGASATILTLNKNGSSCGTPSAVTVTIPSGGSATTVTDSANTCDVAAGDRISVAITGGTTAAGIVNSIMASFQPAAGIAAGSIASGSSGQFSYYNAAGTTLAGQSSLYYSAGNVGVGTTTPGSLFAVQGNGYVSSNLFVGGTITSTSSAASTIPYASTTALSVSGTGFFGTASTTNLTISGISSCSGSSALTTNSSGVVACGAISGSGGTFPFTPATNYGVNTSATSTALWAQAGIYASSTSHFANADFVNSTTTGNAYFAGSGIWNSSGNLGVGTTTPGSLFAVQGNGYVSSNLFVGGTITSTSSVASILPYASTTGLSVSGTGFFGTASTTNLTISSISSCSGSSALTTNSSGVVSCGAIASGAAFPFTPATNFGVNTSATSTPIWAQGGIFASSTSHFASADFVNSTTTSSAYFPGGVWNASGNVGIGTTSPYAKLSVVGQVVASYFTSTSTTATSTFENGIKLGEGKSTLYGFGNDSILLAGNTDVFNSLYFGNVSGSYPGISIASAAGASLVPAFRMMIPDGTGNFNDYANLVTGGFGATMKSTTSSSAITTGQFTILADASGGQIINGLPGADEVVGQMFVVQKTDASANAVKVQDINVPVDVASLTRQGDTVLVQSDPISQLYIPLFDSSKYGMLAQTNTWTGSNVFSNGTFSALFTGGNVGIGTTSPYAKLSVAGQVVGAYFTATSSTASVLPYASTTALTVSGTGFFGTASTTNLTISSISSCSGSSALTTNSSGVVSCGAIASGAAFPFTPATNFGVNTSATSTPIWAQAGIYASSTSQFDYATATALTVTGTMYMPGNGIWNSSGNVGIGTTSPYAKLSVVGQVAAEYFNATSTNATSTFAGRMIVGNGTLFPSSIFAIGSSTDSYLQATIQNTNAGNAASTDWVATNDLGNDTKYYVDLGINSSTYNQAAYNIGGANDAYLYSSDSNLAIGTASTTGPANLIFHTAGTTASNERMRITSTGLVGIGTTTPYAKLSVVGGGTGSTLPSFVVSTTSDWGAGQRPLLYVTATTTGKLDYARVAIGTTSPWGASGLRDQLTVDGRIYSTWRYLSCDAGGSGGVAFNADSPAICGDYSFDLDTDATALTTNTSYPPYIELRSGTTNPTVGDGSAIRTSTMLAPATTSPVFEAWVKPNRPATATVTPLLLVGMFDTTFGTDTGAMPRQGAYFAATSTPNWLAVTRSTTNVETITDTGIATSSTVFNKMRVELNIDEAIFVVNGAVVARHTNNLPTATLAPVVLVSTFANSGTAASDQRLYVSLIRFWFDDPAEIAGPGQEAFTGGVASEDSYDFDSYNAVASAAITAPYLVDSVDQFVEGTVVSFDEEDRAKIRLSNGAHDPNTFGVVGYTSMQNLGEENEHTVRVAMSGRVPVRISLENGEIAPGDFLTASSIKGVAMKATGSGPVLGRAIEVYDINSPQYKDTVMMKIEPAHYSGDMLVQDEYGHVGIGTTSPSYKLTVSGDVRATGFAISGDADLMTDVSHLDEAAYDSYLENMRNITLSTYRYETDETSSPLRIGILADDAPAEILSVNGEDIDIYKLATFTLGGVKALQGKFDDLEVRVSALESQLGIANASSTASTTLPVVNESFIEMILGYFKDFGVDISDGLARFKNVVTDSLTVGTSEKPTGITLYDEATGEPYCLKIVNGKMKQSVGECGSERGEDENETGGGTSEPTETNTETRVAEDTEIDVPSEEVAGAQTNEDSDEAAQNGQESGGSAEQAKEDTSEPAA